jgi:heme/copper-type cytochrome/quinol oxidase subunit 2
MYDFSTTAFSIDVVGHQWYWSYGYNVDVFEDMSDSDVIFDSILDVSVVNNIFLEVDKRLVIPTDLNISVSVTSTDVIHSWAVPQLGIKIDAVPGRLSNVVMCAVVAGVYFGQCSELCGVLHGFMPIAIEAVELRTFFLNMLVFEQ